MPILFLILALTAFGFAIGGLFFKVRHGYLQLSLAAGFILIGAAYFWGESLKIILLSLAIGVAIATGFFVRTRM